MVLVSNILTWTASCSEIHDLKFVLGLNFSRILGLSFSKTRHHCSPFTRIYLSLSVDIIR